RRPGAAPLAYRFGPDGTSYPVDTCGGDSSPCPSVTPQGQSTPRGRPVDPSRVWTTRQCSCRRETLAAAVRTFGLVIIFPPGESVPSSCAGEIVQSWRSVRRPEPHALDCRPRPTFGAD